MNFLSMVRFTKLLRQMPIKKSIRSRECNMNSAYHLVVNTAMPIRERLIRCAAAFGVTLGILFCFNSPAAAQTVSVSPTSLSFGSDQLGVTTSSKKITISNTGGSPVSITSITISGDFSRTTTCGSSLAVAAQCTISVKFTPTAIGSRTGQVTITDNATGSPQVVSLKGTGTSVLLSPKSVSFPNTAVGSSNTQAVTLTNLATTSLSISKISISGTNIADFTPASQCGSTVAGGASCLINVTFTPLAAGTRSAALNIYDNGGSSPQSVALKGSGTTSSSLVSITVSPSNPSILVGKTQPFTATGNYSDNSTQDLTTTVTWSSSNTAVATISNSAGTQGQATSLATGSTMIMATSGTISNSTTLTVTAAALSSIKVDPVSPSIGVGMPQQFSAIGSFTDGNMTDLWKSVTWSSSNTAVATIGNSAGTEGLVTALATGSTTITATSGSISGSTTLTVTQTQDFVLVGAGDIAHGPSALGPARATSAMLDGIPGTIMAIGDLAYPDGSDIAFADYYDPTWGRHKARTKPSSGNHEYMTTNASGYFNYWGAMAGDPTKGYYSYDLGAWHIVVLNSHCESAGCAPGSPQEQWLRADLAAHPAPCTLAYFHIPVFVLSDPMLSSGVALVPLWQALQDAGADLIINGHVHLYARFAPRDSDGTVDPAHGIREIIVGTGGDQHSDIPTSPSPALEVADNTTFGFLKLTLHPAGFNWQYLAALGATFTDSGSGSCHNAQ
jgi:acid phosphatase type 7